MHPTPTPKPKPTAPDKKSVKHRNNVYIGSFEPVPDSPSFKSTADAMKWAKENLNGKDAKAYDVVTRHRRFTVTTVSKPTTKINII